MNDHAAQSISVWMATSALPSSSGIAKNGEIDVCIVTWNQSEETWDCSCHGPRFDKLGKVLNGPATPILHATAEPNPVESERSQSDVFGTKCPSPELAHFVDMQSSLLPV